MANRWAIDRNIVFTSNHNSNYVLQKLDLRFGL